MIRSLFVNEHLFSSWKEAIFSNSVYLSSADYPDDDDVATTDEAVYGEEETTASSLLPDVSEQATTQSQQPEHEGNNSNFSWMSSFSSYRIMYRILFVC